MTTFSRDLLVKGRGQLTAAATVNESGVTFRIDDLRRLEFWAEIHVDTAMLLELLSAVRQAEAEEAQSDKA